MQTSPDIRPSDLGVLLLRFAFGARLIQGTYDNVFSWEHMLLFRDFLAHHGFPLPLVCAVISAVFQFTCGFLWIAGWKTRWASLFMAANFVVALLGVHIGDPYLAWAPALHLLVVAVFLLLNGPGRISLDHRASPGRLRSKGNDGCHVQNAPLAKVQTPEVEGRKWKPMDYGPSD